MNDNKSWRDDTIHDRVEMWTHVNAEKLENMETRLVELESEVEDLRDKPPVLDLSLRAVFTFIIICGTALGIVALVMMSP